MPDAGRVVGTANMRIKFRRLRRLSGQQETVLMTDFHPATWQLMASVLTKVALLNLVDQPEILRLDSHSYASPLVDVVLLIRNYQKLGLAVGLSRRYGRICNLRATK